jgi:hypothetical protein
MKIDLSLVLSVLSILFTLITLYFTYRNFKRQATFENENHLFKLKVEKYNLLIGSAHKLLDDYFIYCQKMKKYFEADELSKEDVDEMVDEIDKKTGEFVLLINEHALLLPADSVNRLFDFYEKLHDKIDIEEFQIKDLDKEVDKLYSYLSKFVDFCRDDIDVDELNHKLDRRIGKV